MRGGALTTDGVQYIINKNLLIAKNNCGSLSNKKVSPHTLRHTTAMQLLEAGVDHSLIALWLGHESPETTQIYIELNVKMKQKILDKTNLGKGRSGKYKANDSLIKFLKGL